MIKSEFKKNNWCQQMIRPRRWRLNSGRRAIVLEHQLSKSDFIYPLFVCEEDEAKIEISSMPGQYRWGQETLLKQLEEWVNIGLNAVCVFPVVKDHYKDIYASEAKNPQFFYYQFLRKIKKKFPDLIVMTDLALDPYSSMGHDGLVCPKTSKILNDETIEVLVEMAKIQAACGVDILGPSDMMDGRVLAMRQALEESGFHDTLIMSYCAKYASAFYGPFRDALDSAPRFGDKLSYQMHPAQAKEAFIEAKLDEEEGADMLMIKPGIAYLDILYRLSEYTALPLSAYQVSGEYAMIKAAGEKGWIDESRVMMESLLAFKRAGASVILTYFAMDAINQLS